MKLIANRQLTGEYGTVAPHQIFEVREVIARELIASGLVRIAAEPQIAYETKPMHPFEAPEVRPEHPFRVSPRDVSVLDSGPKRVATEGDSVLSESDLSEPRDDDSVGRGGHSRPSSRRPSHSTDSSH
jgi:hypothetical protein